MADRVKVRRDQGEPILFDFSLIKLLVLGELRKMKQDWEFFVASSHIAVDSSNIPQSMTYTPSSVAKTTTYVHQIFVKKMEKENEEPIVSQQAKKKGKKLQFSLEEVTTPSKLITRSTAKRMPSMHSSEEPEEDLKAFTEADYLSDKDNLIIELEEQLRKSYFFITQLQHENTEMKKKALEQISKKDISTTGETSILVTPTSYKKKCKGKTVEQS
jgi:hypothetical protein